MTRRRFVSLLTAVAAALPILFAGDVVRAEEPVPPAPNLTAEYQDQGNGNYRIVWRDAQWGAYDLGPEGRIPGPKVVPGIAIPIVYAVGGDVPGMIRAAARRHGVDGERLVRIARCESGFNPRAYNGRSGASGVMQFIPSTWRATPQGRAGMSPFDAEANVEAGAWLARTAGFGQWECRG